jgi:hypothetical protein
MAASLFQATTPFTTSGQKELFFTNVIGVSMVVYTALETLEGIEQPSDLYDYKDKDWDQVATNLRRPPDKRVPGTRATADVAATPPTWERQAPFPLSAMSLKKLKIASHAVRYYTDTARTLTIQNMKWTPISAFYKAYQSIVEQKDTESSSSIPKLAKNGMKVTRWSETGRNFFETKIGNRNAPLAYVIRPDTAVAAEGIEPLLIDQPFSEVHGSVRNELIARLSHADPVFQDDQALIYNSLEDAFRGTIVGPTILPFKKGGKNGRKAWMAIISQHAGKAKWEEEIKTEETILQTRKYKATGSYTLAKHCEVHRSSHIKMQAAAMNVGYNYPIADDRTRVRWLMDSIECNNVSVESRKANIESDDGINGKISDFEAAVAYITPACPVSSKKKRNNDDITSDVSSVTIKQGKGNTGVDLRYHKAHEYASLLPPQRLELDTWRATEKGKAIFNAQRRADQKHSRGGGGGRGHTGGSGGAGRGAGNEGRSNKRIKRIAAATMALMKEEETTKSNNEGSLANLASVLTSIARNPTAPTGQAAAGSVTADPTTTGGTSTPDEQQASVRTALNEIVRAHGGTI